MAMAADPGKGGSSISSMSPPAEVEQLQAFLLRAVPVLLEEVILPDIKDFEKVVKTSEGKLKRFIEDPQEKALFVVKTVPPEGGEESLSGDLETSTFKPTYQVRLGSNYFSNPSIGVAFIKCGLVVEADKPVCAQLRIMNFSEDSPFETLHSYIRDVATLYFTAAQRTGEGDELVLHVQKKINQLEVGLLLLQQNIDIPEISLPIHSVIANAVRKAAESGRKPKVEDLEVAVSDSSFLDAIQKDVRGWVREIQKVTCLERDASFGTAFQEINFWLNLENALNKVHLSPEVDLTLEVLKAGKRFHTTLSFHTDTGLKEAQDKVSSYTVLMRDFPIHELHAANDLGSIQMAVVSIYTHLQKIRSTVYPAQRAIHFIEAISRDLNSQLLKVLGTRNLMLVTYEEFEKIMEQSQSVFSTWDDKHDEFSALLRHISIKKSLREETLTCKFSWRANSTHKKLQERVNRMREFRMQHEQLQQVIDSTHNPTQTVSTSADQGETPIKTVVRLAYENMKEVDTLDLSPEGNADWEASLKRYDERIDHVEACIAARLSDQLDTAKSANKKFRIFSRYSPLLVRARIREATQRYQAPLIQRVKDDIERLHNKFKMRYNKTPMHKICTKLDIPPVSSAIIWTRQIKCHLQSYLHRVESVLGKGWENHVEGWRLKQDVDSFSQKLDAHCQQLFDDWKKKVETSRESVSGSIFNILSQDTGADTIQVNFPFETNILAKEAHNFRWLGFRVPFVTVNQVNQTKLLYPHAVSLMESIHTYELACQKIDAHKGISTLVAALKCDVQELIREGCGLMWESYKVEGFVQKFSDCIFNFKKKVEITVAITISDQLYD